jgi:SNF2 family DNA or RNA helicase
VRCERWVPRPHDKIAVRWLVSHSSAALFMDPGLGKTACTLAAFQALRKAGTAGKMIVVAPRRVAHNVWSYAPGVGELDRWSTFSDLRVALVHGPKKLLALEADADIYVMTFEGLTWLAAGRCRECGRDDPPLTSVAAGRRKKVVTACCASTVVQVGWRLKELVRRGATTLTIDELSRYKHTRSKRLRTIKPFLGLFHRRWGLTGSPDPNGLMDLFGQMLVIDMGHSLGRYITQYRSKYFDPTGFGGYTWKPKPGADKKIYRAIKPSVLAMKAEDHLDMPALIERDLMVDLPPKARRTYDDLEQDLIALIDDDVVTAANAAVASGKCRQVASGGVYATDRVDPSTYVGAPRERRTVHVHTAKTEAIKELVHELQGSPLLIAYAFDHDYDRICKGLKYDVPVLRGGVSDRAAARLIAEWNDGRLPVLCGHPASMGHGLNLQRAGYHVAWYSLTWDFELYDQLVRRVYRSGNAATRVFVHRVIARDTVDEVIATALRRKQHGQNELFEALKTHLRRKK